MLDSPARRQLEATARREWTSWRRDYLELRARVAEGYRPPWPSKAGAERLSAEHAAGLDPLDHHRKESAHE